MIEAIDNNKFMLYSSTITPKQDDANDGELILTGMASSNSKSLYGEVMSEKALQQMCETAIGLPILYDHEGKMGSVAGVVKNAYLQDNDLYLDFSILPRFQDEIKELLDYGVLLGLSIGGMVSSFDMKNELVEDITLVEVSLTPVPANRDTHGTVMIKQNMVTSDCLYGVCNALIKENLKEDEIISEEIKLAKPQEEPTQEKPVEEKPADKQKEEPKDDEPVTLEQVKELLDERFAEEKQSIIETVLDEVKNMLNNKEEDDDGKKEEPAEVKESAEPTVNINLDTNEIAKKVSEEIFGELENRRGTQPTKVKQATPATTELEEVKKFTSEEAAKLIIQRMDSTDPLARAINQSLKQ